MALTKAELIELITAHEHEGSTVEGEKSSVINALKAFLITAENSSLPPHTVLRFADFVVFSPETTTRDLTATEQYVLTSFRNKYSRLEESSTLCFYVNKDYLSLTEAQNLISRQRHNLVTPEIKAWMEAGFLSFAEVRDLAYHQRINLASPAIKAWIDAGLLSFAEARDLAYQQNGNLTSSAIKAWIDAGLLSFAEARDLTHQQWINLISPEIKAWMDLGLLSFAEARDLTSRQQHNLTPPIIKTWIDAGLLGFAEALDLTDQQRINLISPEIKAWVETGLLSFVEVRGLNDQQCNNLCSPAIKAWIGTGLLSFAEARDLTTQQRQNLVTPAIKAWIKTGLLTIAEARDLTAQQWENLISPAIKVLKNEKRITLKDALALNHLDRALLERPKIQTLLRSRTRNEATIASLTDSQKVFLATLMRNAAEERRDEICRFRFFQRNAATFHDLVQLLYREQETMFLENLPAKPSRLGAHTIRFADGSSVQENLLHVAARLGRKASMDELVKRGMDLSSLNSEAKTALQLYAEYQTAAGAAGTTPVISI